MPLAPGRQVTESLRLVRLLGKGGMGSVWVAEHLGLRTQVAVKFMSAAALHDPTLLSRFEREASAAAQIKSPHVVQTLDHGIMSPEGAPYIVMELLEGEDLASRLKRFGPAPMSEVVAVVSQVGKALIKAHQAGIIHRDIKPDNLFLLDADGDLFVKVLDFGVAKQASDRDMGMTSTGSTVGTPHYMSPEQLLSAKHVDHRCDLWALAVVAYRMLTGQLPFRGETLGALSVALHQGVFKPPSAYRADLGPAVDAWFARALHREIDARFDSVKELLDELGRAARTPPPLQSALAEPSSHPTYMPTPPLGDPLLPQGATPLSGPSPAHRSSGAPSHLDASSREPELPLSQGGGRPPSFTGSSVTHAGAARPRGPMLLLAASITFLLSSAGLASALLYRSFAARAEESAKASAASSGEAAAAPASAAPPESAPSASTLPEPPLGNTVATGSASATTLPDGSSSASPSASASAKGSPLPRPPPLPRRKERDRGF
jgi:serine/threonine protein kinase